MKEWCFKTPVFFNVPCSPMWVFREKRTPERGNSAMHLRQDSTCDIWTNRTPMCMVHVHPCLWLLAKHFILLLLIATASNVCLPKPMQISHRSSADHSSQSRVVPLWHTRHLPHLCLDSDSNSLSAPLLGQCVFHGAPLWLSQSSTADT